MIELSSKSYCKLNGGTVSLLGLNLMLFLLTHVGAHEKTLRNIYIYHCYGDHEKWKYFLL